MLLIQVLHTNLVLTNTSSTLTLTFYFICCILDAINHVERHFILKVYTFSVTRAFILKGCVSLVVETVRSTRLGRAAAGDTCASFS